VPFTVSVSESLAVEMVVVAASGAEPVTEAAEEDWATVIAQEPNGTLVPASRLANPSAVAPVASSTEEAVVTTDVAEATPSFDTRMFAWASWFTVKVSDPVFAPGEATAVATPWSELVALARFHADVSFKASAALSIAWRSVDSWR
jgi:hypothetical protein